MVFSSTVFLLGFLPLFLLVYFVAAWRPAQNLILLGFSLLFYAWGEPVYVWLMVGSILGNWLFSLGIGVLKPRSKGAKLLLALALIANLLVIGFYKYQGFLIETLNGLGGGEAFLEELTLELPIGISFYTLQAITYIVDVYRTKVRPQKNPLYLGMYIAMFPQLVAGPIVRYADIEKAITSRQITLQGFVQGLRLFCIGLGKKVLLANTAAGLAEPLLEREAAEIGFVGCSSAVLAYSFQIYFDFSGYSDMAIGLGKMIGFDYPRNFNYPYSSASASEFWRRWHISLGSFFRDYVYIPLGGNRVPLPRYLLNIFIVWFLTGLWHGAAWNFVLWDLYWGLFITLEKAFAPALNRIPRAVRHLYTLVLAYFGWLLFAVKDIADVGPWLAAMVGTFGLTGDSTLWELQAWSYLSLLPVAIIGSLPWAPWLRLRLEAWAAGGRVGHKKAAPEKNPRVPLATLRPSTICNPTRGIVIEIINGLVDVTYLAILVLSAASIVSGSYNPFIYFQF